MFTPEEKKIRRKARKLITPLNRWTQETFTESREGRRDAAFYSDAAYKFCARGALLRAAFDLGYDLRGEKSCEAVAHRIACKLSPAQLWLHQINDAPNGHVAVLALFDKALAE